MKLLKKIFKTTTSRREYKLMLLDVSPYDDRDRYMWNNVKRGRVGYHKKKGLFPSQMRCYKTWKHNRYKQWKE